MSNILKKTEYLICCELTDDRYETRCAIKDVYVPSDERFSDLKKSDFDIHGLRSVLRDIKDKLKASLGKSPKRLESLKDVYAIYEPRSFFRRGKFPMPQVIEGMCNPFSDLKLKSMKLR